MTLSFMPQLIPFKSFEQLHDSLRQQLTQDIRALFTYANLPSPLDEACRYVMTGNGKLVRPLLVASTFASIVASDKSDDASKGADDKIIPDLDHLLENQIHYDMCRRAALAVELLHTYSLVHDDLPCMDDDELRRGQPTCHIAFDEATAMLTGDVLQTLAFEVLSAELPNFMPFDERLASKLSAVFTPRARRMVAGQMLDLNAEASTTILQTDLEAIHRDKTGALIEAAMLMGGICAGATATQRMALQDCAQNIGLAFQVQDDILDVTTSTDDLGKPSGSDEKLDKSTYVKLMGVDAAKEYAQSLFDEGRTVIKPELADDNALLAVIEWLWNRQR